MRFSNVAVCRQKVPWWLFGLDAVLVLLGVYGDRLAALMMRWLPACAFAQRGVLCPACGGTRCVSSLCQGAFGQAFSYNPVLFLVLMAGCALVIALHFWVLFRARWAAAVCRVLVHHRTVIGFAVSFVVFGLLRNV